MASARDDTCVSTSDPAGKTSVMAGEGMYNRHSAPQHVANELGLGLLTEAAEHAPLDGARTVGVADYGASQGRNSLEPMREVIRVLRGRLEAATPISIVHTDLADNDFAALFTTLRDDPQSYLRVDDAVFPSAVGRSFYELILPPDTVSVAWAAVAVHWWSHAALAPREHIFTPLASEAERAAFAEVAASDREAFLTHRATGSCPRAGWSSSGAAPTPAVAAEPRVCSTWPTPCCRRWSPTDRWPPRNTAACSFRRITARARSSSRH